MNYLKQLESDPNPPLWLMREILIRILNQYPLEEPGICESCGYKLPRCEHPECPQR